MVNRRVEREIEEILSKAGDLGHPQPNGGPRRPEPLPFRPRASATWVDRAGRFWARLAAPGQAMFLSLGLAVVAYGLQVHQPLLAKLLAMVAIALFIAAYAFAWRRPQNLGSERRWRGQVIDYDDRRHGDLGDRLRQWWRRLSQRR
ncbi:MAG: hypothetical protein NZ518_01770 [Dehalococcoidia bacterium]|nr:hypothetical protein [Dehalococcoidia bacterium]